MYESKIKNLQSRISSLESMLQTRETDVRIPEIGQKYRDHCPASLTNRFLRCQNVSRPPIVSACRKSEGVGQFKCAGIGDRVKALTWTLYQALDDCRPFFVDWQDHDGILDLNPRMNLNESSYTRPTWHSMDCEHFDKPHRWADTWDDTHGIEILGGCGSNPRVHWSSKLIRDQEFFSTLPLGFEMGCLFFLIYSFNDKFEHMLNQQLHTLQEYKLSHKLESLIGVHLRVGDRCLIHHASIGAEEKVERILSCAKDLERGVFGPRNSMFYFASDCADAKKLMKKQLGEKVYMLNKDATHIDVTNNVDDKIHSWIEFFLLSSSDAMVYRYSGYSISAGKLGFVPFRRQYICGKSLGFERLLPSYKITDEMLN